MQTMQHAARAYEAATNHRSTREQEADVFRRVSGLLRVASTAGRLPQVRALADNRRLWIAVADLVRDSRNRLPEPLRAGIISLAANVECEMDQASPNLEFLANINDHLAAGLSGLP